MGGKRNSCNRFWSLKNKRIIGFLAKVLGSVGALGNDKNNWRSDGESNISDDHINEFS